jgi:hypothetical protein
MSLTLEVAVVGNTVGTPQGARRRHHLHLRWWVLPDYRRHPQGPVDSSTSEVVAAGNTDSTPRGPAIDVVFIFSGGYCRTTDNTP